MIYHKYPQRSLEEAKLLFGVRERFLQIHSGLLGHKEMHASPAMQKATATSSFSLTESFQKVTRAISNITQLAVTRFLNFCKSEYVIVINTPASKYSTEALAIEGGCLACWYKQ